MANEPKNHLTPEPSVWDYIVNKLRFWDRAEQEIKKPETEEKQKASLGIPWLVIAALVLALMAQLSLEPSPGRTPWPGIFLYLGALVCWVLSYHRGNWQLADHKQDAARSMPLHIKLEFLLVGLLLALIAFLLFGNGIFGFLNTFIWILSLVFVIIAFLKPVRGWTFSLKAAYERLKGQTWTIRVTRWTVVVLAVIAVILFFNFYRLNSVPPEMLSDQAEKLLDIYDILQGHTPVYFPRNTGREVLHFYLSASYMAIFNLDISFLNLKVVAVFANLLTLFFIYLFGKEFANKWVGLSAALFAGMAYWPLLFTRLALRIPYYPLFVAPVLYFMIRGLRRQNINDIILTGLFLGLGLHGYTPFRIVPIFVVVGSAIYFFHPIAKARRIKTVFSLVLIAVISLIVFIPLLRFWLANPDLFAYRAFSRLTGMEVNFQTHPIVIFLSNFWKASIMFFWDNGVIWAHSIPGRPALEVVSGAFYFLGIGALILRYIKKRNWMDLFLLVSIPMLLMPSILSLAYPGENPSLNRTAGAVVPVFVVMGLAFETVIRTFQQRMPGLLGKILVFLLISTMIIWSGLNNFDLVFNQYNEIYTASSWNTSEIGSVAALFIETMGSPENTFVVGYPHWIDSRLVAINAGFPGRDFAIFPEQIPELGEDSGPKIFFVNINDTLNMQLLADTFENGVLSQYDSKVENKDLMIFFVPPTQGVQP